jgi:hypothetical protein
MYTYRYIHRYIYVYVYTHTFIFIYTNIYIKGTNFEDPPNGVWAENSDANIAYKRLHA